MFFSEKVTNISWTTIVVYSRVVSHGQTAFSLLCWVWGTRGQTAFSLLCWVGGKKVWLPLHRNFIRNWQVLTKRWRAAKTCWLTMTYEWQLLWLQEWKWCLDSTCAWNGDTNQPNKINFSWRFYRTECLSMEGYFSPDPTQKGKSSLATRE